MRDNADYRAANGRAQGVVPASFACPRRGRMFNTGCGFTSVHHRKGPILPSTSPSPAATPAAINQKVSIPMVCIPVHWNGRRHGMDWYPMHWSPLHTNAIHSRPRRRPDTRPGKGIKNLEDLSLQFGSRHKSPGGEIMPSCVACAAELAPPVPPPTPSTSRACTASPDRTTATTTS